MSKARCRPTAALTSESKVASMLLSDENASQARVAPGLRATTPESTYNPKQCPKLHMQFGCYPLGSNQWRVVAKGSPEG